MHPAQANYLSRFLHEAGTWYGGFAESCPPWLVPSCCSIRLVLQSLCCMHHSPPVESTDVPAGHPHGHQGESSLSCAAEERPFSSIDLFAFLCANALVDSPTVGKTWTRNIPGKTSDRSEMSGSNSPFQSGSEVSEGVQLGNPRILDEHALWNLSLWLLSWVFSRRCIVYRRGIHSYAARTSSSFCEAENFQ